MANDPTGRALQLLSLLQTHRFWAGQELAARLSVTERTVRRDVDRLRELGYPVAATTGRHGGYRLETGAHMPPLVLDDDEAVAISVGLRYSAEAAIDGMEETSLRALTKVEELLPHRLRRRVSALHASVSASRRNPGDLVDPAALTVLAAAVRDHEPVRFRYRRHDGEEGARLAEPHRLVTVGQRWYLAAWDRDRGDWRTFRVDRLRDARAVGGRFAPRDIPGGSAAEFVARSLGAAGGGAHARVTVHATVDHIVETLRWIDHTVRDASPGRTEVEIHGEDEGRLAMAIARIGLTAPVTVHTPSTLAATVETLAANLRPAHTTAQKP